MLHCTDRQGESCEEKAEEVRQIVCSTCFKDSARPMEEPGYILALDFNSALEVGKGDNGSSCLCPRDPPHPYDIHQLHHLHGHILKQGSNKRPGSSSEGTTRPMLMGFQNTKSS